MALASVTRSMTACTFKAAPILAQVVERTFSSSSFGDKKVTIPLFTSPYFTSVNIVVNGDSHFEVLAKCLNGKEIEDFNSFEAILDEVSDKDREVLVGIFCRYLPKITKQRLIDPNSCPSQSEDSPYGADLYGYIRLLEETPPTTVY